MKKGFVKLSKTEKEFISSLFKDASKTDSDIANEIGVSKASVSRIRKKLIEEKVLVDFTPIIDFEKIGIKLFAMVTFDWGNFKDQKVTEQMQEFLVKNPHTILLTEGESVDGLNYLLYLGFEDLEDYHEYFSSFRKNYGEFVKQLNVFFIPINKIIIHDYGNLVVHALKRLGKHGGD